MFGSLGFTELLIILIIVLILFGGKKIPSLARDIGSGIREFKRSLGDTFQQMSISSDEENINLNDSNRSKPKKTIKRKKKTTTRKKKTRK